MCEFWRSVVVICLIGLGIVGGASAVEWNQFRGPNGQGVMEGAALPGDMSREEVLRWKVAVPEGNSSPVLWGNRIFMTGFEPREDNALYVLCLSAVDGREIWRKEIKAKARVRYHPMSNPAAPTPVVDGERVYVYFGTNGLLCFDHDGALVWEEVIKPPKNSYGMATSPILYRDTLIQVLDDNQGKSRVVALDCKTGEQRWETSRSYVKSGWSTPSIWKHELGEELVILGAGRLASYDPKTGDALWWANGMPEETVGVPIIGDGLLIASSSALAGRGEPTWNGDKMWDIVITDFDGDGDGVIQRSEMDNGFVIPFRPDLAKDNPGYAYLEKRPDNLLEMFDNDGDGVISKSDWDEEMKTFINRDQPVLLAIKPGATRNARMDHVAWQTNEGISEIPSPLLYRGRLYLVQNGGKLSCLKADTGEVLFREKLGVMGQYCASPVAGDGKVYIISVKGVLVVLEAGDSLKELSRLDLGEKVHGTPAIRDGVIYVRGMEYLYAFGG